jgi:hypothetical protein
MNLSTFEAHDEWLSQIAANGKLGAQFLAHDWASSSQGSGSAGSWLGATQTCPRCRARLMVIDDNVDAADSLATLLRWRACWRR